MPANNVTIDELRSVPALSDLPDEHLQWILDRSDYKEYQDGECMFKTGDPIDVMWMVLEGSAAFYMDINGRLVYYITFGADELTGGVGGILPYSRLRTSPGYSYAQGKVRIVQLHKDHFPELERLNPTFIQRLIGYMTDRARYFATMQLQQEKVSALGKLSAGIAHELNNPASAINRTSSELSGRLMRTYDLTEKLLQKHVSSEHVKVLRELASDVAADSRPKLSPLKRIEKEDEITDWMDNHKLENGAPPAEAFVEAGLTVDQLERIYNQVGEAAIVPVLCWLENLLISDRLIKDVEDASARISRLVTAIKSHVHMDRTNDVQQTQINHDLDNTLTLLGYKIRQKGINVVKEYDEHLPHVEAFVGELNQVWTNIIDNAIYASPQNSNITIKTSSDGRNVITRIIDNGPGIPENIKSRIFDPFFTTKKVGDGTGIGLDIVSRIVKRHNGDLKVSSEPGRTEFLVCIPIKYVETEAQFSTIAKA